MAHPEILAFVQSLGLTIPSAKDIDWSQVLQIGIQVLPTIISSNIFEIKEKLRILKFN